MSRAASKIKCCGVIEATLDDDRATMSLKEQAMGTTYETDVVAWANEQAALLRSGNLSAIDALHIAEEIEDVGKSEQRELASRLAVLLAHLLKWQCQTARRSTSWRTTIRTQRRLVERALRKAPSLKHEFDDEEWLELVWADAVDIAARETGLTFPDTWLWPLHQVLDPEFLPD
jgi:hypothetical protein